MSDLGHDAAIKALCDCAATVTVLSYQEAIEGYFTLRGLPIPPDAALSAPPPSPEGLPEWLNNFDPSKVWSDVKPPKEWVDAASKAADRIWSDDPSPEGDVEKVARIISPSSWAVMDAEKARMLRKYRGENIGYDPEQFQHKESMRTAREILAALGKVSRQGEYPVDERAFHVVLASDGATEQVRISDRATLTSFPAPGDRLNAHTLARALNDVVKWHVAQAIHSQAGGRG